MLLNPAILALIGVSLAVGGLLALAGVFSAQVLCHWDFASGSERQLNLERRTYLISTLMRRQTGGMLFAGLGLLHFAAALVAVVSCIALYVYEHPHHHCPFCLLKPGHDYVGYWLYLPLFAATSWSLGVGAINHWRPVPGITAAVTADSAWFTRLALIALVLFHGVAAWAMLDSGLTMQGVWW